MKLMKNWKIVEKGYMVILCLLRLDHLSPIPEQDYVCPVASGLVTLVLVIGQVTVVL